MFGHLQLISYWFIQVHTLFRKYCSPLPADMPSHELALGWMGYVEMLSELTVSDKRYLSDKVMTICLTTMSFSRTK